MIKHSLAWNTQKNKITDVKGKEKEQLREGRIRNDDIDLNKTNNNYDLVQSNFSLYQRVKNRVDSVRSVSRIQKNSVVMYSNIITISQDAFEEWGEERSKAYMKETYNYFCNEFGSNNVVSAMVHMDETTPHMHLHFVPVSEQGKLQAAKVMTPGRINKVHTELTKHLVSKGFNVERGIGETGRKNIKDIHKYKSEKLIESVKELENKLDILNKTINNLSNIKHIEEIDVSSLDIKNKVLNKNKLIIDKDDFNSLLNSYTSFIDKNKELENKVLNLQMQNLTLENKISISDENEKTLLKDRAFYLKEKNKIKEREVSLLKKEDRVSNYYSEVFLKEQSLNKEKLEYKSIITQEFNSQLHNKDLIINAMDETISKLKEEKQKEINIALEQKNSTIDHLENLLIYNIFSDMNHRKLLKAIINTHNIDLNPFLSDSYDKDKLYIKIENYKDLGVDKEVKYTLNSFDKLVDKFSKRNLLVWYNLYNDGECILSSNTERKGFVDSFKNEVSVNQNFVYKPILENIFKDFIIDKNNQKELEIQRNRNYSFEMDM